MCPTNKDQTSSISLISDLHTLLFVHHYSSQRDSKRKRERERESHIHTSSISLYLTYAHLSQRCLCTCYSYSITIGTITFAERNALALGILCPFALHLIIVAIVLAYPNKDLGNETTLQHFASDATKHMHALPFPLTHAQNTGGLA